MKYVRHTCPDCFQIYEEIMDDCEYPRRRNCQHCGEKMNKPIIEMVKRKSITGRKSIRPMGLVTPSDGE